VLDDERQVAAVFGRMLSSLGFVTLTFTDVSQCLHQLKQTPEYSTPSLIVLDLRLQRHDAIEVCAHLKKLAFKGRVLLMSGVDEHTSQRRSTNVHKSRLEHIRVD
jgi:CheY-like chemotaxis protein